MAHPCLGALLDCIVAVIARTRKVVSERRARLCVFAMKKRDDKINRQ